MEKILTFHCLRCVKCCNPERFGAEILSIPIYEVDEVDKLRNLARQQNLKIRLEPDLMYFDELNNRLIIVTYALQIDTGGCPFHKSECTIYEERPLTCRAYPLSVFRTKDTSSIMIKPECSFVQQNNTKLKNLDFYELSEVFSEEFPYARQIQIKGNAITNQIEQLELEGKVKIPVKLPVKLTEEIEKMKKIRLDEIK
ncbi:MAG: YkgJ family cysteine cluster protein [Promethearchaeota archaeon]